MGVEVGDPAGATWRKQTVESDGSHSSSRRSSRRGPRRRTPRRARGCRRSSRERRRRRGCGRRARASASAAAASTRACARRRFGPRRRGACRTPRGRRPPQASPAWRTRIRLQLFCRPSHLCASSVTESARSSPGEQRPGRCGRRRRQPVGAIDVKPDAVALADVGDRGDRVDRAGQRRAAVGDHGDRDQAGVDVRRRSPARARRRASAAARRSRSRATKAEPIPAASTARTIEWWASSEQ